MSMHTPTTFGLPLFGNAEPKPEPVKTAEVLDRMAVERRDWLRYMRTRLVQVFLGRVRDVGRERAYVTTDDAWDLIDAEPTLCGLPAGASPNLLGALFRGWEWQAIDREHVSTREGSHGNLLTRWRYVGREGRAS
ncbi:MAG: hypothetical protein AMXMBFR53_36690 [Gemmatimonadota bacterium]